MSSEDRSAPSVGEPTLAEQIVYALDDFAREVDSYDYGLPVFSEKAEMVRLVAALLAGAQPQGESERERVAAVLEDEAPHVTEDGWAWAGKHMIEAARLLRGPTPTVSQGGESAP